MPKHFTASGFVFAEHKLLLVFHTKMQKWLYPGGHVEENESPDESFLREVEEETGCIAKLFQTPTPLGADDVMVLPHPHAVLLENMDDPTTPHQHVDFVYLATARCAKHDPALFPKAGWFTYEEALQLDLLLSFRVLMDRVRSDLAQEGQDLF